jgi:hypothetical protein
MALNLSRNTRVWFTTNVNSVTGVINDAATAFAATSAANTFEIQVLDGYSFSQATTAQDITINEAGTSPVRGKRAFNTALNPADFTFSTYIRPVGTTATTVTAIEKCLWNALAGDDAIDTAPTVIVSASVATRTVTTTGVVSNVVLTGTATGISVGDSLWLTAMGDTTWNSSAAGPLTVTSVVASTNTTIGGVFAKAPAGTVSSTASASTKAARGQWFETATGSYAMASLAGSNKNQLQKFGLIFQLDNAFYAIDNCALNQAVIDFGLDAISTIAWSGNGTAVKQLTTLTAASQLSSASAYNTAANYITNKLSTVSLVSKIGGNDGTAGTSYIVPITGGSITINNNIKYITPSNIGVVNQPIGYYTGTRAISGTLNAYLRTGTATETGALLTALLASGAETKYKLQVEIGGITNAVHVELEMPGVTLQVPSVDVKDVVSTTINFSAQGSDTVATNQLYDITATNDLLIRYYSA